MTPTATAMARSLHRNVGIDEQAWAHTRGMSHPNRGNNNTAQAATNGSRDLGSSSNEDVKRFTRPEALAALPTMLNTILRAYRGIAKRIWIG